MEQQMNNQSGYNVRKPTEQEYKRLKGKAIPWIIIGIIIAVVLGMATVYLFEAYVFDGFSIGERRKTTSRVLVLLGIFAVFGVFLIYRGIKLLIETGKMMVTQVRVLKISDKSIGGYSHSGTIQYSINGQLTTIEAPIIGSAVKSIRETGQAKLYFILNKSYLLDKI